MSFKMTCIMNNEEQGSLVPPMVSTAEATVKKMKRIKNKIVPFSCAIQCVFYFSKGEARREEGSFFLVSLEESHRIEGRKKKKEGERREERRRRRIARV